MGVKGGHNAMHLLKGVSLADIYTIADARCRMKYTQHSDASRSDKPTIDVDASWLIRSCVKYGEFDSKVAYVIRLCLQFVRQGFMVVLVCDGNERHHSKRATIYRKAQLYRKKVECFILKTKLASLAQKRRSADLRQSEIKELISEEKKISDSIKSIENKKRNVAVDVGNIYFEALQHEIENIAQSEMGVNGGQLTVCQAEFQADSVLAWRCVNGISDIILANDSDVTILAGSSCIAINKYKFQDALYGPCFLSDLSMYAVDIAAIQQAAEVLGFTLDDEHVTKSEYPIFQENNPEIRALYAIILGCDVCPSGINNIGYKKLYKDFVKKEKLAITKEKVMQYVISKVFRLTSNGADSEQQQCHDFIETLEKAYLFEPANHVFSRADDASVSNLYIHGQQPAELPFYIHEFARRNKDIILLPADPSTCMCVGPGSGSHLFLRLDGAIRCSSCQSICCRYCAFGNKASIKQKFANTPFCVECYMSENSTQVASNKHIQSNLTVDRMIDDLLSLHIDVQKKDSVSDIMDLHEALFVEKRKAIMYPNEIVFQSISMPYKDSNYILTVSQNYVSFNIKAGGSFIRDNNLSVNDKLGLIKLLGQLVYIDERECNNDTEKYYYQVVPKILIHFAKHSRIGSGFRLIKRAIRHAMDARTPDIYECGVGKIVQYQEQPAILINHKVMASMKSNVYDVQVCFASAGIVSCSCTCKAGSFGIGRVLCVHILPVILQLTVLLFDGLAEHLLYEFAAEWEASMTDNLDEEHYSELFNNIVRLIDATTKQEHCEHAVATKSISAVLNAFDVATNCPKLPPRVPYNKSQLGPLREIDMRSPVHKLKSKINNNNIKRKKKLADKIENGSCDSHTKNVNCDSLSDSIATLPNYKAIQALNKAISKMIPCQVDDESSMFVANMLLHLRSQNDKSCISCHDEEVETRLNEVVMEANMGMIQKKGSTPASFKKRTIDDLNTNKLKEKEESFSRIHCENHDKRCKATHHFVCAMQSCKKASFTDTSIKAHRTPPVPPDRNILKKVLSDDKRKKYFKSVFLHKEWIRRLQLKKEDYWKKDLRICKDHITDYLAFDVPWWDFNNQKHIQRCELEVPLLQNETAKCGVDAQQHSLKTKCKRHQAKVWNNCRLKHRARVVFRDITNAPKTIRTCNFVGCPSRYHKDPSLQFKTVPQVLKKPDPAKYKTKSKYKIEEQNKRHKIRLFLREEALRRMGIPLTDHEGKDFRLCDKHGWDDITREIEYMDHNGVIKKCRERFRVPKAIGSKSNLNTNVEGGRIDKGVGNNRFLAFHQQQLQLELQKNPDLLSVSVCLQEVMQKLEEESKENESNDCLCMQKVITFEHPPNNAVCSKRPKKKETNIRPESLNDSETKDITGFPSLRALFYCISAVCNGDIDIITHTSSYLTWFEEWIFFFERIWGRTAHRWKELEKRYGAKQQTLRKVFRQKLNLVMHARSVWPYYVTIEEDELLRKEKWNKHYKGKRAIMWDNTNISLTKKMDADVQRITYSPYYASNVGKGAVFLQLCGWMGTHEIWTGAVSDSDYMVRSGILKQQKNYIELYDFQKKDEKFINILDKGYRITCAAWQEGEQDCLQPAFAKSDVKFTTEQTLRSAAVASDRGGNERAVRNAKLSAFIKDGIQANESVNCFCDVWLAWSFLCNWIFKPVL